ncbi:glycosyltransferase 2 family protein [Enterococcus sp. AZ194]|uniref:lysylphosphatidylglycerol synthase transmembrane domain-containing protein n=1 Tax=Enterococcus sp. AZ194 TaxID=2774629 RepID=UPI003F1F22AC
MKKNSKLKVLVNIAILAGMVGIILYLVQNSLADIFAELRSTSFMVLAGVLIIGTISLLTEGQAIKEISKHFEPSFSRQDGFWTSCYVAFYRIITFGTGTLVSEVYFYRKKGLKPSQGVGVTTLHMVMYKFAVITYAVVSLIIQFSLFYSNSPKMIPFILAGMILTIVLIIALLALSSSVNLQVFLIIVANRLFKSPKIRGWVDTCNLQIYSLRDTVNTIMQDRTAVWRIYTWNLLKLALWYIIPYFVLMGKHSDLDFLQAFSFTSFAVILSGVVPTPGGIGSFEFVYLLLLRPIVGTVDAISSVLLYRFGTFVLPFLFGFVYVLVEKRKKIQEEIQEVKKERKAMSNE